MDDSYKFSNEFQRVESFCSQPCNNIIEEVLEMVDTEDNDTLS